MRLSKRKIFTLAVILGIGVGMAIPQSFVNPVKDALRTRTDDTTTHVLAAIYAPATLVRRDELERICNRFADWLAGTAPNTESALAIADPGESIVL